MRGKIGRFRGACDARMGRGEGVFQRGNRPRSEGKRGAFAGRAASAQRGSGPRPEGKTAFSEGKPSCHRGKKPYFGAHVEAGRTDVHPSVEVKMAAKKKARKAVKRAKRRPAKKAARRKSKRKPNAAFMRPVMPDKHLSAVVGAKAMPRTQLTKKLWAYIKRKGLQDRKNRRMINADAALKPVFNGRSQVSMFEMTKLVNRHVK